MRKWMIGLVTVLLAAGAIYVFISQRTRAEAANTTADAAPILPALTADSQVVADAVVVPVHSAELSLSVGGIVVERLVAEGDQVHAGQILLRLNSDRQAAAVAQAAAGLARVQAQLVELKAGATEAELRAARATVASAQAGLDRAQGGPLLPEIAVAQATRSEAQAALQRVLDGPEPEAIIAAEAELANAEAQRRQAQAAYDRVSGDPHVGARPEAAQLEQATNSLQAAQARLAELQNSARATDIAGAQAQVQRAQAQLDLLITIDPAEVAAAEADIQRRQAELDLLAAGPRPETIAVAKTEVASALAMYREAAVALAETELRAPFAGTVAALDIQVGEQVAPGQVIVQLADLSTWQVETDDLTELSVVRVQAGDRTTITFDALPDLELHGTVVRIRPVGENKMGDITYTVIIRPDRFPAQLRWNMTATVRIEPS